MVRTGSVNGITHIGIIKNCQGQRLG